MDHWHEKLPHNFPIKGQISPFLPQKRYFFSRRKCSILFQNWTWIWGKTIFWMYFQVSGCTPSRHHLKKVRNQEVKAWFRFSLSFTPAQSITCTKQRTPDKGNSLILLLWRRCHWSFRCREILIKQAEIIFFILNTGWHFLLFLL